MRIGIIGALEEEIVGIKAEMEISETKMVIGTEYHIGKICEHEVVLALCGVGKVNAAICAQAMIDLMGVERIINSGVAGAIAVGLNIGDVVISKDFMYHDMDVMAFGYAPGIIPRIADSTFVADAEMSKIANLACKEILEKTNNKVVVGRIVTGDQFINSNVDKQRILNDFKATCAEMEGCAIAHTCYLNKIPFVAIRAISDSADDSADYAFDRFLTIAAERSGNIVINMLSRF